MRRRGRTKELEDPFGLCEHSDREWGYILWMDRIELGSTTRVDRLLAPKVQREKLGPSENKLTAQPRSPHLALTRESARRPDRSSGKSPTSAL